MATSRGVDRVRRFIASLPADLERKVLPGAMRAAANVVAHEARTNAPAEETRAAIKVKTQAHEGRIVGKVVIKPGWGRTLGKWGEYGTDPHFISVDASQRRGMSVRRINDKTNGRTKDGTKKGSLVIGGHYVGTTVHHPGTEARPFLRPAFDTRRDEAITAARAFMRARITRAGIIGSDDGDDE